MILFEFLRCFLFYDSDDLIYQDLPPSLEIDICFFAFGSMPDFHVLMSTIYIYLHHPFAAGPPKKVHSRISMIRCGYLMETTWRII